MALRRGAPAFFYSPTKFPPLQGFPCAPFDEDADLERDVLVIAGLKALRSSQCFLSPCISSSARWIPPEITASRLLFACTWAFRLLVIPAMCSIIGSRFVTV